MRFFIFLAAIAEEKKRQREDLKRQLDQYISRAEKMKRELKVLKDQKSDLLDGLGKRSPSPKTNGFIKENEKLQVNDIFQVLRCYISIICHFCVLKKLLNAHRHIYTKKKSQKLGWDYLSTFLCSLNEHEWGKVVKGWQKCAYVSCSNNKFIS